MWKSRRLRPRQELAEESRAKTKQQGAGDFAGPFTFAAGVDETHRPYGIAGYYQPMDSVPGNRTCPSTFDTLSWLTIEINHYPNSCGASRVTSEFTVHDLARIS